jgi:hypothetical protein
MEAESTYLFTLASVSITFVGFAGLFMAFRQAITGKTTKFDILLTRNHFLLSFMVVAASLLPPLLLLFPSSGVPLSEDTIWRAASIIAAIPPLLFAITYPARRYAASGSPMPTGTKLVLAFLYVTVAVLLVNATGIPVPPGAALYALGLTLQQFTNIFAFIYALRFVLDESAPSGAMPLVQPPQA